RPGLPRRTAREAAHPADLGRAEDLGHGGRQRGRAVVVGIGDGHAAILPALGCPPRRPPGTLRPANGHATPSARGRRPQPPPPPGPRRRPRHRRATPPPPSDHAATSRRPRHDRPATTPPQPASGGGAARERLFSLVL